MAVVDHEPSGTILLVEDDKDLREFLYQHLQQSGHAVLQAGSGREALERLRRNPEIDLVVTDLVMPELSGDQLALELRVKKPELPILFISGNAAGHVATAVPLREGENFLRKPFSFEDLDQAIRRLLPAA